jgi:Fic family protein
VGTAACSVGGRAHSKTRVAVGAPWYTGRMATITPTSDVPAYRWKPIEPPPDPASLADARTAIYIKAWQRKRNELGGSATALSQFDEELRRRWAIETGILERLYDISRGTTKTLVERGFVAALIGHGEASMPAERLVTVLNDHLEGLDMVMDVVATARPFSTSWIKELHALMTRGQATVEAQDPLGRTFETQLLRGEWKRLPNSPTRPDGRMHEYCPPEHVAAEMDRLMALHAELPSAHPEVRAAWLHHAFTQIHPFQDGNGRVARALASVDLIRAGLFPVVIDRDQKTVYVEALEHADQGDLRPLVSLFVDNIERDMLRALGIAEKVLDGARGMDAVIRAAANKVTTRQTQGRSRMTDAIAQLDRLSAASYDRLRAAVQQCERVPGVRAQAARSTRDTEHYYYWQVTEFARRGDYWADLREPRFWTQLAMRDGGNTKVVFVFHFIGNPTQGDAIANVFLEHRDPKERESSTTDAEHHLVALPVRPLLLPAGEALDTQMGRFATWHAGALETALAQWVDYL